MLKDTVVGDEGRRGVGDEGHRGVGNEGHNGVCVGGHIDVGGEGLVKDVEGPC